MQIFQLLIDIWIYIFIYIYRLDFLLIIVFSLILKDDFPLNHYLSRIN